MGAVTLITLIRVNRPHIVNNYQIGAVRLIRLIRVNSAKYERLSLLGFLK